MAFVPEILAPRGALRAAATPSAGTRARAPRPEPGRDSTPLFFRVARARPRLARPALLTLDHYGGERPLRRMDDRSGGGMTAQTETRPTTAF